MSPESQQLQVLISAKGCGKFASCQLLWRECTIVAIQWRETPTEMQIQEIHISSRDEYMSLFGRYLGQKLSAAWLPTGGQEGCELKLPKKENMRHFWGQKCTNKAGRTHFSHSLDLHASHEQEILSSSCSSKL